MNWYNEAANDFIKWINNHSVEPYYEVENIKYEQENDARFHFDGGMWFRNVLRYLGYTDDKYGNLDDHYISILKIIYKNMGIN